MKTAIEYLEPLLEQTSGKKEMPVVVIATVEGDIHDIGKNLVALMLKNYGFKVIDLGKDVPKEQIIEAAKEHHASVIALSALMTTTMQEMKEVIAYAREQKVEAKIIIGGAVITQDYADEIGADGYSKDAADAVKLTRRICRLRIKRGRYCWRIYDYMDSRKNIFRKDEEKFMNGADAIIKCLEKEGVEIVFGYPGVAICPFYNSILDSDIRTVLIRTEQNAAHAASGFTRVSGKPGVCAVTSGPGATNVITGIATAFADSIPLICITGQVNSELIGSDVFRKRILPAR